MISALKRSVSLNSVGIIQKFKVSYSFLYVLIWDLERYAQKIGALSEAEIRVRRDRDEDAEETMRMKKPIREQEDDLDDDWE